MRTENIIKDSFIHSFIQQMLIEHCHWFSSSVGYGEVQWAKQGKSMPLCNVHSYMDRENKNKQKHDDT